MNVDFTHPRRRLLLPLVVAAALAALLTACAASSSTRSAAPAAAPRLATLVCGRYPRQVFAARADGTGLHQVGGLDANSGEGPALLSPNGRLIAVTGEIAEQGPDKGQVALTLLHATGAVRPQREQLHSQDLAPLAWSPDSRYVAVEVGENGTGIAIVDTTTGRVTARVSAQDMSTATFAPSGADRLAYETTHGKALTDDVFEVAADGSGGVHQLTHDGGPTGTPLWTPEGIVYNDLPRNTQRFMTVGHGALRLTGLPLAEQGVLQPVAASADGRHLIAFSEPLRPTKGSPRFTTWAIDLGTGTVRKLISAPDTLPVAISRDGSEVLYGDRTDAREIPFAGGPSHLLVHDCGPTGWSR